MWEITFLILMGTLLECHLCNVWFILALFFHKGILYSFVVILRSEAQDLKTTSSSSFHTHLPSGPRTRVGRRWPRVETGDRLSRIGRGEVHARIGGKLIRSLAIISRGGNRQLQKQGQVHSRWTASRGTGSTSAATEVQRRKEKRRKRVNFAEEGEEKTKFAAKGKSKRSRRDVSNGEEGSAVKKREGGIRGWESRR